jgi:hypothetical protein|tara:strand:- start:379 stop:738 length:360 start_codon:yes stop_codon:yes gene_type:complete
MGKSLANYDKWKYTLQTTVLFLIVVNPLTYKLVNMLIGKFVKIANNKGCPTIAGMLVHALVFTLLLRLLMEQGKGKEQFSISYNSLNECEESHPNCDCKDYMENGEDVWYPFCNSSYEN